MAADIHPTASVDKNARLEEGVTIGAYALIGSKVRLGTGTVVHHHATVEGNTRLGKENEIFPYAFVGGKTQDLKYKGGDPGLEIGDHNVFREFCTVHTATEEENSTTIGSHNNFMAYCHVAHNCTLGDHIIMSNNATLAGHVTLEDHCIIGGLTAIHQFCHIGLYAMLGGCAKVVQDVPPYMICDGNPAKMRAINRVGLFRAGFSDDEVGILNQAFKTIYREGLNRSQALEKLKQNNQAGTPKMRRLIDFIENSQRGIT